MLNPITNTNSQGMLKEYGIKKPKTKNEYKLFIWDLKQALEKFEDDYKKKSDNLLYSVEGLNGYKFEQLKEAVTKLYDSTTKKEMNILYGGVMRSVHKLKKELK